MKRFPSVKQWNTPLYRSFADSCAVLETIQNYNRDVWHYAENPKDTHQ